MDTDLYVAFVIASIILIIVPGQNVLVVVSTSLSHGLGKGLLTVFGTTIAMVLQLLVVALGTILFVESLTAGLVYLRWFGVAYLLYLGTVHLFNVVNNSRQTTEDISASNTFARGFFISLSNPKTLLFFAAFLPQFIIVGASYTQQFILLSVTFLVLAMLLDSLYAILAGKVGNYFEKRDLNMIQHGVSGILFIVTAMWLMLERRL